jgi:hypothetical protein
MLLPFLLFEAWLGRKRPGGASSILSIFATIAVAVIVRLIQKERNDGKGV